MKKLLLILFIVYCSLYTAKAQDQHTVDSLLTILKTAPDDTDKINLILAVGYEFEERQSSIAISYYKQALQLAKKIDNTIYSANCLEYLGFAYEVFAKLDSAQIFYLECIKVRKAALGSKNSMYATALNNLAELYRTMGNYAAAEPLYLEAKNIRKEILGKKHPLYASDLNNLALLYYSMGNYSAAEPLYLEAKNIDKEMLGGKHPDYATDLNNLALLYKAMGDYPAAEPLYLDAMNIRKEVLGKKHPDYAQSLNNLAVLYNDMGNYSTAEPLYLEAKNIRKEVFGEKHPDYAQSLHNLAYLYKVTGNYLTAEPLFLEAKNIYKEVLGEKHPHYAISLSNLAGLYQIMGDNEKAEFNYLENLNICLININQNFGFLSEKEKGNYIKTLSSNFNEFSAFVFKRYKKNPLIAQNLYNITLATKGLLLSSSNRIRDEINNSSDTAIVNQYKKWQTLKEDIGRFSQWSKAKLKKMNVKLDSLENEANSMEKELSLKSNAFSNEKKNSQITWKHVQNKLTEKDAAVEFITYKTINPVGKPKNSDTTLYCALVVRKNDKYPQMLTLCNNFELSTLLEKTELYNTASGVKGIKPIVNSYVDDETESRILYGFLWKPLDTLLAGREKIYVSLTGLLNKIAFEVLRDDKGALLLNKYDLCFVNSTRQLAMEVLPKTEINKAIVLYGGINYDVDINKATGNENKANNTYASQALPSDTSGANKWNYLPGTLTEVDNIDKLFTQNKWLCRKFTDGHATEEAFKTFSGNNSPSILHISTHGFFFPAPDSATYKTTRNPFKTMLNPLWRSGIILAGANNAWQCKPTIEGQEDGVLTAYEVANCNLRNTDLVVLSACETGLGDIKTGEGVYGLQRAFQVAGAKAVIMSLWQVPDKETTELMTLFYDSYIKTKNKHESFRKAQQTMAKKYAPYYWAAFVLVE